ncbi:hypothetical protein CRUP_010406 [Coryphaenoides rupestris]|nr:hypothetical protein CRUP_010406 [Coryphaenoides rupestris]
MDGDDTSATDGVPVPGYVLRPHQGPRHPCGVCSRCESCRAKLRSYRGLLAHLHTCSKVSRSKLKTEPGFPLTSSENWSNEQATPQQDDAADDHMQVSSHGQHVDNPLASPPHLDQSFTPLMDSQEPSSFQQVNQDPSQFPPQTQDYGASSFQIPHAEMLATDPLPFDGQAEHQGQFQAQPQSAPLSPTSSAAVWKKNQGQTGNSRILWEHTRGRYTCTQCNLSLPNRKAMTAHIHTEHKTPKEN